VGGSGGSLKNCILDYYHFGETLWILILHSSPTCKPIINVLIEITAGSKNKYEYDKEKPCLRPPAFIPRYNIPTDYGFVPNTG